MEENLSALLELQSDALEYAVGVSVKHKADVVRRDEREQGVRALLNLGHTFGHAIEASAGYGEVLHGEAVSIGMVCAAHLSNLLGDISAADLRRVAQLLDGTGLPVTLPPRSCATSLLELMALDKKNQAGRLRLVLLDDLGDARLRDDIDPALVIQTLEAMS